MIDILGNLILLLSIPNAIHTSESEQMFLKMTMSLVFSLFHKIYYF